MIRKSLTSIVCFHFCLIVFGQGDFDFFKSAVQKEIHNTQQSDSLPGVCLSISFSHDEVFHFSSGVSSYEDNTSMKPNSRLMSGSTGKMLFSAVILQAIEQGLMALDDPAINYLKDFEWYRTFANYDQITIRQLLNHTSGLPRYIFQEEFLSAISRNPSKKRAPIEAIQVISQKEAVHEPGKSWAYSDSNYILLGLIYEELTGRKIYDDVIKSIIKPAGLVNTSPSVERKIEGIVQGYLGDFNPFGLPKRSIDENGNMVMEPSVEWTGGGFVTSAGDLARLVRFIHESEFLNNDTKKSLISAVDMKSGQPSSYGYGLGTFVWQRDDGPRYGHLGFFPGYLSLVEYSPLNQYSIGIQINHDGKSQALNSIARKVDSLIRSHINEIDSVLIMKNFAAQEKCWNDGDLECYMKAYATTEEIVTLSSAGVTYGYENILGNYKKYFPEGRMGTLFFDSIRMRFLEGPYCFVYGRFNLKFEGREDLAQGYFSTICKKINGEWYLITDHSS